MSWETVRDHRKPCPCGQGYVHSVSRSDDWGRWENEVILHCPECEKTYVKYSYDNNSKGMVETTIRWVKRNDYNNFQRSKKEWKEADLLSKSQITEYLRLHYLEWWMALFKDVRRANATLLNVGGQEHVPLKVANSGYFCFNGTSSCSEPKTRTCTDCR